MPLELGEMINGGAAWLGGSRLVSAVMRNPVVVALLITAIAMILIFTLFKVDLKGRGWRPVVKTGFWLGLVTSALVFIHYYISDRHFSDFYAQKNIKDVVASIHSSAQQTGGYDVFTTLANDAALREAAPAGGAPAARRETGLQEVAPPDFDEISEVVLPSTVDPLAAR